MQLWEDIIKKLKKFVELIILTFKIYFVNICIDKLFGTVVKLVILTNLNCS
jgi:hypothetical protein